jgi:tetratricopeptide (TPR) repeat protein
MRSRTVSATLIASLFALLVSLLPRAAVADEGSLLAREHFRRGKKAYDLGHYNEAAREYEQAYEAKESPALLYNLGQAYRLGGQPEKALAAYRAFLRNQPNAENRDQVLAFIETLKQTIEAQKQAKEKPPTDTLAPPATDKSATAETSRSEPVPALAVNVAPPPRIDPRPRARLLKRVGLGVGAFGIASLALGGTFAGLTASVNNNLNHPPAEAAFDPSLEQRGTTYQTLSGVFFAVGGVAVVSGTVIYIVGARRARAHF